MKIGIIGTGNIGEVFINGLLKSNTVSNKDIYGCARSEETIQRIINKYAINMGDIIYVYDNSDIIFWAVKSEDFYKIVDIINLSQYKIPNVSFMANISLMEFRKYFSGECVLAMPTIAMENLNGITAYTNANDTRIRKIFEAIGYAICTNENELNKLAIFVGCGLGFAAYILDAYVKAGIEFGLDANEAIKITSLLFREAATTEDYQSLISKVATKGGLTEKGIKYLDKNELTCIFFNTLYNAK